jgi:hypothetical protein
VCITAKVQIMEEFMLGFCESPRDVYVYMHVHVYQRLCGMYSACVYHCKGAYHGASYASIL